jgi:transcriptional regulator with PAS, ATPase and Fis domain
LKTQPSLVGPAPADDESTRVTERRFPAILGRSPGIVALRRDLAHIAASATSTVLVLGETGTGKELVARAIHESSSRAAAPFLAVNCSAVPATLLEQEFFGYEAGAFTDARKRKPGLLEAADGGTIFLDEIGELDPGLQAKFLRFLEDGRFRKLGGTADVDVDVRFVAATNVDLEDLTRRGTFRKDLYYRLQVITLTVPPLRDRPEDVPLLARHFLEYYATRFHKPIERFSPEAVQALTAYAWPGNVRELRNAVERVVLLEDRPVIDASALRLGGRAELDRRATLDAHAPAVGDDLDLERLDLDALVRALARVHGNISRAARLLGISRDTVRYRMKKHGVRLETRVVVDRPPGTA